MGLKLTRPSAPDRVRRGVCGMALPPTPGGHDRDGIGVRADRRRRVYAVLRALLDRLGGAPPATMPDEPARALVQAEAYLGYDDIGRLLLGTAGIGAAAIAVPASSRPGAAVSGLARLARRRARDRVPGDGRLPRNVRLMAWIAVVSIVMLAARTDSA